MIDKSNLYELAVQALKDNDKNAIMSIVKDINLDDVDYSGETLLWKAVQRKAIDIVNIFLDAGANVNIPDNDGWTPLHIAVQNQDRNIVEILLRYNPEINAQNKYGNNPLWVAVFYAKGQRDIIKLLLEAGADPYLENHAGINALRLAQTIANYDNISIFKSRGFLP